MDMSVSSEYATAGLREAARPRTRVEPTGWVRRHLQPHLAPPMRVLDVGCGHGAIAAEVARRFPDHEIVAIDASESRVAFARRNLEGSPNASAITGSAEALPFEEGSFDFVYSRFLLGHVPGKQAAVDEFARVCRPGGTVLLQDLEGQILDNHPPDPGLQLDLTRALELLATTGFDPDVGPKLPCFLERAGLSAGGIEVEPYEVIAGAIGREERAEWQLKLAIAVSALTRLGFDGADDIADRFLRYLDREDTVSCSRLVTAWARKEPGRPGSSNGEPGEA